MLSSLLLAGLVASVIADPCADIAGLKWTSPKDVRACIKSFPVDNVERANIIDVLNKTSAFHTSVNYAVFVPPPSPYTADVHEDILKDLGRIRTQSYPSDLDLHVDLSRSYKRNQDGHFSYINYCYDSFYVTYLPTPLVLLTDKFGIQNVHIAPEAFAVATAEFPDQVQFWQDALPGALKGKLESLSGAKVLFINNNLPFVEVNKNAAIAGSYQAFGTRQNGFFASYSRTATGWNYIMGQAAQQALPLNDEIKFTIQRVNSTKIESITIPYRSRFGSASKAFTDSASYRANNCKAVATTNGANVYDKSAQRVTDSDELTPLERAQQMPIISAEDKRKHLVNVLLDDVQLTDVVLPPTLAPPPALPGGYSVAQFYMLKDGKTGVLALGSFSAASFATFQDTLLKGLQGLKAQGASKLVVDVTNNGGGYICIAHWLHRIIAGPAKAEPQAGLDSKTRAGPLAQLIVKKIVGGADPDQQLLYNPTGWTNASNVPFGLVDWLDPAVLTTVNGRKDAFSQRLGAECFPYSQQAPAEGLFDPKKVVIVSNGRCASSCSLFSISMSKKYGTKTVVVGGQFLVPQAYSGTVGGQSTDYSTIDTEVKSTGLKDHPLAPPDFTTNSVNGITWRLGFGIDRTSEPEEWQSHAASVNLPLTLKTVNNPVAIWEEVAGKLLA